MLKPHFSIEEIISNSWEKFKHDFIFWIGVTLFAFLISALGNLSVVLTFVSMYFSASISLMYINFMRNNQVSINDLVATNLVTFMHFVFVNICLLVLNKKFNMDIMEKMVRLINLIDSPQPSCSLYRPVAHEYLDSFRSGLGELRDAFRDEHPQLWADWLENNMRLWGLCQSAS